MSGSSGRQRVDIENLKITILEFPIKELLICLMILLFQLFLK